MKFCSSTVKASPFLAHISRLLISAQVDRRFEIRFWNLSKTIFNSFGVKLYWSVDESSLCGSLGFSTVLVVFSSINFILNWFCGISYSGLAALPSFETFNGFITFTGSWHLRYIYFATKHNITTKTKHNITTLAQVKIRFLKYLGLEKWHNFLCSYAKTNYGLSNLQKFDRSKF